MTSPLTGVIQDFVKRIKNVGALQPNDMLFGRLQPIVQRSQREPVPTTGALCICLTSPDGSYCRWKEGNILFNDALNTFYLRLYGVGHMVKDHSDSERGNQLPPKRLLFPISSNSSFIFIIPQTGALAGTRNSIMGPAHGETTHRTMSERSYHGATSRSLVGMRTSQWVHHERSIRQAIAP